MGFHDERKQDGGAFMAVIERPRLPGLRTLAARNMFMPRLECLAEFGPQDQTQNGPRHSLVTCFYFSGFYSVV